VIVDVAIRRAVELGRIRFEGMRAELLDIALALSSKGSPHMAGTFRMPGIG
jgi:hypothetical protein